MEDAALPGWVLPVTLVLGAIVLAFIRVWFGIDEKKNRSECWSDRLLEEAHLRAGLVSCAVQLPVACMTAPSIT